MLKQRTVVILSLWLALGTRLTHAAFKVTVNPEANSDSFQSIDLPTVDKEVAMGLGEWQQWVADNNGPLVSYIMATPVASITVSAERARDRGVSMDEYVQDARRAAARVGANKLYLESTSAEEGTGRLVDLHFRAYRITYKRLVIPPAFMASLPYTPLPEYYVDAQLTDWNAKHVGHIFASFANRPGVDDRHSVIQFVKNLKNGTPVRVALRDGRQIDGVYSGVDEGHIWINPSGFRGIFMDRALLPTEVQAIGILN